MIGIGIGIPFFKQIGTAISSFLWGTATEKNWGESTSQNWG
jgi:hypothetical protein